MPDVHEAEVALPLLDRERLDLCGRDEGLAGRDILLHDIPLRLDDHRFRLVAGNRQGGSGAGNLPNQVAGLRIKLSVFQGDS